MARLKIIWTNTAIQQRNLIFEYWNKRNGNKSYSRKLNYKIKERIEILKLNPYLGKSVQLDNIRLLPFKHYSILYKKYDSKIVIIGFWDNRQNPKRLLALLNKDV